MPSATRRAGGSSVASARSPPASRSSRRALGTAKGTIGHHVRVLEEAGLIRLAETPSRPRRDREALRPRRPPVPAARGGRPRARQDDRPRPSAPAIAEARPTVARTTSMSIVVRARMSATRARASPISSTRSPPSSRTAPWRWARRSDSSAAFYVPDWAARRSDLVDDDRDARSRASRSLRAAPPPSRRPTLWRQATS